MKTHLYLLFLCVLFCCASAWAQTPVKTTITGNYANVPFQDFVQSVESQTPFRFYFNPLETDSLRVNLTVQEQPIAAVLEKLFQNTGYAFAIDASQRIFVVKGSLQPTLPTNYFARGGEGNDAGLRDVSGQGAGKNLRSQAGNTNRLYEIGLKTNQIKPGMATITGTVLNSKNGQPIEGAVVKIENPFTSVTTDQNGFYAITLPKGRHELKVTSVGMRELKRQIMLYSSGKLTLQVQEDVISLNEVLVLGNKDKNVASVNMGVERLDIRTIKQVPTVFGEADVLKVVLTLPGVKSVGESSTGLNVRGGATDQNLILYNGATIFNPSHLFGFLSAFNPDVVQNVELYKSSIPAKHGGRLASVLEVTSREGNKEKLSGSGGLGLIASRLLLEGPIVNGKTSFLVSGRSTYSNWLLKKLPGETLKQSKASFYDVNASIHHQLDSSNTLSLNGYLSHDEFRFGRDTLYTYQNQNAILKWGHIFNYNLSSEVSAAFSRYQYTVGAGLNPVNAFDLAYDQKQTSLKVDFNYTPAPKHSVDFGGSTMLHQLAPGHFTPKGAESLVSENQVEPEQALESALYLSDAYEITPRLSVTLGLRYSFYQYLGSKQVFTYGPGVARSEGTMGDTLQYGAGDVIKTYHGPEYRASARFMITDELSVKAGYNRTRQYLHMLTNSAMMSPTDIWKLSDSYLKPLIGDQYSLGLFRNFKKNAVETSVEVYYKTMRNVLDYRSGAELLLNHHIETDVINSRGKAYGVELLLKKATGRLNGWVSYTYSRSLIRSDDAPFTERINKGKFYPSNFDKPHDVTLIGNYRFSRRINTSLNLTYSTGRPITLPMAVYEIAGSKRIYYSERNQYRIPDYYRADVSLNLEGGHRVRKLAHSSWTLAIYNVTGRRNPYSVYFRSEGGSIKAYKLSVFGQPIPTVTYNFKF